MDNLIVIRTIQGMIELEKTLSTAEYVAYDTETTGVLKDSKIIGFSVAVDDQTGYYVVLSFWDTETKSMLDLETLSYAKTFLQKLIGKKLIQQNAPFDCSMTFNNFGIELMPSVHTDTLVLGHLLDENRRNGLKELGVALFGADAKQEQDEVKESVTRNGGVLTKASYELYKADSEVLARYGAKDAILTMRVFYTLVPQLYEEGLDQFFYQDETMPLLRGPTYDMNMSGLRVDGDKLQTLKKQLQADCLEAKEYITRETLSYVIEKYPGTNKTNHFNINSGKQLAWLVFHVLGNTFNTLTKEGRTLCKALGLQMPYSNKAKREFIVGVSSAEGNIWQGEGYNYKTKKKTNAKKVGPYWNYLSCGKESLSGLAQDYNWIKRLLEFKKNEKLLNTYVEGIEERAQYNIIRPNFLQHGTTSGRYSCRNPNFQNLPRDDKRVKSCIAARAGKIFVGADYSQLEPRVFASFSKDERLLKCFEDGDDFYSVIGAEVFEKDGYSLKKDDENSFANKFPQLRSITKIIALSATYGTTAPKMAPTLKKSMNEAQEIIDNYFEKFPNVLKLMLAAHEEAKTTGRVHNLFGRPRRMPKAKDIPEIYGKNTPHAKLPYEARNLLNLAINHTIQSTGASIMNRSAIAVWNLIQTLAAEDSLWKEVKLVLQIHDEMVLEGPEELKEDMIKVLKHAMENTVILPGVKLLAEPVAAYNLAELKG